jgi:hypothetical protein
VAKSEFCFDKTHTASLNVRISFVLKMAVSLTITSEDPLTINMLTSPGMLMMKLSPAELIPFRFNVKFWKSTLPPVAGTIVFTFKTELITTARSEFCIVRDGSLAESAEMEMSSSEITASGPTTALQVRVCIFSRKRREEYKEKEWVKKES